ncbi:hypothetical protein MPLDJ20_60455 [Mesorhizobium plurifarium]|uniref:Uncharacterized protein n=1 Tax=Mesorhizobium plurifarium TaxID=69974 RepID=A0A090GQD8_MESPL|nr:hypothetical protein MPLDJ20_60455 [Mesorhizobium plurifarium]
MSSETIGLAEAEGENREILVQTGKMLGLKLRRRIFAFAVLLLGRTLWRVAIPSGQGEPA